MYFYHMDKTGVDLRNDTARFEVRWFDPRTGGDLQKGTVQQVTGGQVVDPGLPPAETEQDWCCLLKKI